MNDNLVLDFTTNNFTIVSISVDYSCLYSYFDSNITNDIQKENSIIQKKSFDLELIFNILNSIDRNREDKSRIILRSPFDFFLLKEIFLLKPYYRFNNSEDIKNIDFEVKYKEPEFEIDLNSKRIILKDKNNFLIYCNYYSYLMNNSSINICKSAINNTIIRQIFEDGFYELTGEDIEKLTDEKSSNIFAIGIKKKIIDINDAIPVMYFENVDDGFYVAEAYHRFNIGGNIYKIDYNFEDIRKRLLFNEVIYIQLDNENIIKITPDSNYYNRMKQINNVLKTSFYSILNEIRDNKIITKDYERIYKNLFSGIYDYVECIEKKNNISLKRSNFDRATIRFISNENKINWFEVDFEIIINGQKLSLSQVRELIKKGYIKINNEIIQLTKQTEEELKFIGNNSYLKEEKDRIYFNYYRIPDIIEDKRIELILPDRLKNLKEEYNSFKDNNKILVKYPIPLNLGEILRKYQKYGFYWLKFLNRYNFSGILADEMGLGKTIQTLTLLCDVKDEGINLIVCPTSLMYNWAAEIQKFIGLNLRYVIYEGNKDERISILNNIKNYDIMITSYTILNNDIELLKDIEFNYCVLDEANHIKNKNSKRSQSVKLIKSRYRLALTGTPIENNLSELWSIFDFLMPGFLGSHSHFYNDYIKKIEGFDVKEKEKALVKLKKLLKPFILRRVKSNVLKELPPKIEQNVIVELSEVQKNLYIELLAKLKDYLSDSLSNDKTKDYIYILSALTRLRQICLHPSLLGNTYENDFEVSIKLKVLMELLNECIDSGHRVIVFSQFVEMLKIIRKQLLKNDMEYFYIDGSVKDRVDLINRFNENENIKIFLISLKAGGSGFNIVGADSVILFDPWWNPAIENQAIDRVHRIGQLKTVNVYRLITKGTIEEKIQLLQSKKQNLFENVIESNEEFIKRMSLEELYELLS